MRQDPETSSPEPPDGEAPAADRRRYVLRGQDDFVRLDSECLQLLRGYYAWLQEPEGPCLSPEEASPLAHAADRFLRDFVVDIKETGPGDEDPTLVRQYLSNWYIIHTLEPSHEEMACILEALGHLYAYLSRRGVVSPATAERVAAHLAQPGFYHKRLEDFWALTPDGIPGWRAADDYRPRRNRQ